MEADCFKCKRVTSTGVTCIICSKYYHPSCASTYKYFKSVNSKQIKCCKKRVDSESSDEIVTIKKTELIKIVNEAVQDQLADLFAEMITQIKELKEKVDLLSSSKDAGLENDKLNSLNTKTEYILKNVNELIKDRKEPAASISYANIVSKRQDEVLIIKPVKEQNHTVTLSEVKKKIAPASLQIGVGNVKHIKEGGIAIHYNRDKENDKVLTNMQQTLGENYTVASGHLRNPEFIVTGVEKDFITEEGNEQEEKEIFLSAIIQQNKLKNFDNDIREKIKIRKIYLNKWKSFNIIIEISPNAYKFIASFKKLNIGWRQCNIYEHHNIMQCFKCYRFGHQANVCKNGTTCSKCSEEHSSSVCQSTEFKCINCSISKVKLNMNLNASHTAYDRECPCYVRLVEQRIRSTKQSQ